MPFTRELTPKQFAYVLARAEGKPPSDAYRQAYKPGETTKPNTIARAAQRQENNPRVQAAIKQRQAEVVAASQITAERVVEAMIEMAFDKTIDNTNRARAIDMLAKVTGAYKSPAIPEGVGALVFCLDGKKPEIQPKTDAPQSPRSGDLSQGNMIPFPKTAESGA